MLMRNNMPRSRARNQIPKPRVSERFPLELHRVLVEDLSRADLIPDALRSGWQYSDVESFIKQCGKVSAQSIQTSGELAATVACKYLLGSIVRKYPFEQIGQERRRAAALQVFTDAEDSCSRFNVRGHKRLRDADGQRYLAAMREFVVATIGEELPEWELLTSDARHGPGASVQSGLAPGAEKGSSSYAKYVEWPYTVTADALEHARLLIERDERWMGALEDSYRRRLHLPMWSILDWKTFWSTVFEIVPGNRVTTVPKDGLKDRTIAIEPTMNMMLQLGVDGFVRKRLRRWGIDLDYQGHNCWLARKGSLGSDLVTLDLSAASDTVSLRLCKMLLPKSWYEYLCSLRSPRGELPGGRVLRYSKISSMGNGFTFVLESLLFAAIIYASCVETGYRWNAEYVAVYGDDLVMPGSVSLLCVQLLQLLGFYPNAEKSFFTGPFRESCGTDWYCGCYIRPVFLKSPIKSVCDVYALHNRLRYWSWEVLGDAEILSSTLAFLRARLPAGYAFEGPESMTEVSSYLHSPKQFRKVTKVIFRPRKFNGREFFFRRLMNPLHQKGPGIVRPLRAGHPKKVAFSRWLAFMRVSSSSSLAASLSDAAGSVYDVTRRSVGKLVMSVGKPDNSSDCSYLSCVDSPGFKPASAMPDKQVRPLY